MQTSTWACKACRHRKLRCDRLLLGCSNCRAQGTLCDFSSPAQFSFKQAMGDSKKITFIETGSSTNSKVIKPVSFKPPKPIVVGASKNINLHEFSKTFASITKEFMFLPRSPQFFVAVKQQLPEGSTESFLYDKMELEKYNLSRTLEPPAILAFTPHSSVMKSLAQGYFKYNNPYFPILEPSVFFKYMEEPNPSLPKQALIAVVCLSGAWFYSDKSYIKDITTFLAERLCGLFTKVYSKPCVQTVQAFLIACLEQNPEHSRTILKHSWYYYVLACDMARMLGFYRKNPRLDPFVQEERTRIWMGIYTAGIAYHISTGKHYSISYAHTDIPLWQLKDKKKTNVEPLYGEDKYIVNHFRNIMTSSAIVEMLYRAKHQFQHFSRDKDLSKEKRLFHQKLKVIEKYYISWYASLPSYLYSKEKVGVLSIPSHWNRFSSQLHTSIFYYIMEINYLKLEPQDWLNMSFAGILNSQSQIRDRFTFQSFFSLSSLERSLVAAHFGVLTLISPHSKNAVFHGYVFKWVVVFQIAMFLKLLKKNNPPPEIVAIIDKDLEVVIEIFKRGASKLTILKASLRVLIQSFSQ